MSSFSTPSWPHINANKATWQPSYYLVIALLLGVVLARLPLPAAAMLLIGLGLFILLLIQPLVGLALALVMGPLGAFEDVVLGPSLPPSGQLVLLVAIAAWLSHSILRRRINLPYTALNWPLTVFILIAAFSLLGARSLDYGLKELLKWLEVGLVMLMVVDMAPDRFQTSPTGGIKRDSHWPAGGYIFWILAMLLVAGATQAAVGIWQFALWENGPDHFLILDRFYRAFGTFMQPNPFGGYMGMTASLAIGATIGLAYFLIRRWRQGERPRAGYLIWLLFIAACAGVTFLALLMSWSRGAWLGFAAAMTVLILFLPKKRRHGILFLVGGFSLLLVALQLNLVPASIAGRLGSFSEDLSIADVRGVHITIDNYAVIERLAHWQAGAEMARDNLWTGVGFGNYEPAYSDYGVLNWIHPLGHAHNYYLNVLAETGVFGAIAYLLVWLVVFIQGLRLLNRLDWPYRGLVLGLLAAWTALSVHHVVDKLYVNNLYLFIGVMLGMQQLLAKMDD